MSALQPIYNLPIAYKQGGFIEWASNSSLSISSVLVRSSENNLDINIGDYFGAQTNTVLNAAINGLNGLDTGSLEASKVYAVHAIADQAGYNPSGFLLSLSATAPLLPNGVFPSNYNAFSRIGWAVTDSGANLKIIFCSGLGNVVEYVFDAPEQVLNAGTANTQTAVNLVATVPAVNLISVKLGAFLTPAAASRTAKICPSGQTIATSQTTLTGQVASVVVSQEVTTLANLVSSTPRVDYIMSNSDSSLTLYVNGFTDYLS